MNVYEKAMAVMGELFAKDCQFELVMAKRDMRTGSGQSFSMRDISFLRGESRLMTGWTDF